MDPLDAIRATFFEECAELLETLEAGLLALQAGEVGPDTVDGVFRAVHSIKGGAGAFDLAALVTYAHEFETALDGLRVGRLAPDPDVIAVFLRASDALADLVAAAQAGTDVAAPDPAELRALDTGADGTDGHPPGAEATTGFAPVMIDLGLVPEPESARPPEAWEILFEPLPDLLASGNEPLFLFRALEVLGRIEVECLDGDLPTLTAMDPRVARLRWRILLTPSATDLTETEVESIFEFAVDLCVLQITPRGPLAADALTPAPSETPPKPAPTPLRPTRTAASVPTETGRPVSAVGATIRVDLGRVDRLVNLVGELVISQSMLAQGMARAGLDQHSEAVTTLEELQQLTRDMQDSVMSIRAQPVKSLFQRMTRIVREAAQATAKDVRLVTDGEATEIDKTVVERLADPLTHMIRNAIDHGLEEPGARAAAGKPATGIVRLSARQQSDRVVIEVSDDGRGIDRARVLKRATERGLVPPDRSLEPVEIDRLLFLPGFSTSAEVSALSGRGVGMDVVQRAIRDLNGTISINSVEGAGCTLSISLPLTLAILDGMIVRSGRQRMVLPLSAIVETQTLAAARVERLGAAKRVVALQGRFVPLLDLAEAMGFGTVAPDGTEDEDTALLFVEPDDSGPFALCVDAIEAQRQVVIKGLGDNFGHVPCVSAATILGDGQVALIVDPSGIAAMRGLHRGQGAQPKEAIAV
ncbi:chemotaxis protein CheA [Jannaschia marina]|uniref:chemotaxis protein CheA n=1 Tax=Jannaschia marina TaxID=2741674 RepID=UPI0015C9AB7A|nr:chemotaxis protein CheA [Jannaschia marina]